MQPKYTYRLAAPEDVCKIIAFVNMTQYFCSLDEHIGGQWVLAETSTGELKAVAWFFYQGHHAYIDYWTGDKIASTMLALYLYQTLKDGGIKYVRATVANTNERSKRLCRSIGMQLLEDYCLAVKEL